MSNYLVKNHAIALGCPTGGPRARCGP